MTIDFNKFSSVTDASSSLSADTRYFAGGTLLMRVINYSEQDFTSLVSSDDPSLKSVSVEGENVRIGAGVTMREIISNTSLEFLAEVARSVGGPAIRNMATIGGNLFAPRPYGDMTTALLALGASLRWSSGLVQTIDDFLANTPAATNDIVMEVIVPRPAAGSFRYMKVSRVKPKGVALMSIAVLLKREAGRLGQCRVAFGGMGPVARRATAAENALMGSSLDEHTINTAISCCTEGLNPEDDSLASAWYRNEVAPVYLRRLLEQRS